MIDADGGVQPCMVRTGRRPKMNVRASALIVRNSAAMSGAAAAAVAAAESTEAVRQAPTVRSPAVVDMSPSGLAATLSKLRKVADRAVEQSARPPQRPQDLSRAERLLKGKGEVFEDIALGAAVTADVTMGLVRRHSQNPQETSLGTWAFGRRLQTPSVTTTIKLLAAAAAVFAMCATLLLLLRGYCPLEILSGPRPNCSWCRHRFLTKGLTDRRASQADTSGQADRR